MLAGLSFSAVGWGWEWEYWWDKYWEDLIIDAMSCNQLTNSIYFHDTVTFPSISSHQLFNWLNVLVLQRTWMNEWNYVTVERHWIRVELSVPLIVYKSVLRLRVHAQQPHCVWIRFLKEVIYRKNSMTSTEGIKMEHFKLLKVCSQFKIFIEIGFLTLQLHTPSHSQHSTDPPFLRI